MVVQNPTGTAGTRETRQVVQATQIGASLQVVCLLLPLLDLWVLGTVERHVQAAYPQWGPDNVSADRTAIVVALVAVSVLGLACWLVSMWVARRGRGVRATMTTLFILGTLTLLTVAGMGGGAYDQIVPLWLGLTSLVLPVLPGLAAVVAAWSGRSRAYSPSGK
ncbi:hypothetical protein [Georgenia deserti]|uniref:DUF2567 domain-containing protein n=1 Tax=Georgenia deserti TaxID=2093781 RepID=A0ABW4L0Z0_9MICO